MSLCQNVPLQKCHTIKVSHYKVSLTVFYYASKHNKIIHIILCNAYYAYVYMPTRNQPIPLAKIINWSSISVSGNVYQAPTYEQPQSVSVKIEKALTYWKCQEWIAPCQCYTPTHQADHLQPPCWKWHLWGGPVSSSLLYWIMARKGHMMECWEKLSQCS